MSSSEDNCFSLSWGNLVWTPWLPLSSGMADFQKLIPMSIGFYRVRVPQLGVLAYIGQTGRDLRERTRSLARHTYSQAPPWNDPHTAAPGLWAWRMEEGLDYEVSVAPKNLNYAERQCYEDLLLFEYRLERGKSTLCNHGRFHRLWSRPSNRKAGVPMRRLEGQDNPAAGVSLAPVRYSGNPTAENWCELSWSPWLELKSSYNTTLQQPGVYRLMDESQVVYIGESYNLLNRLQAHAQMKKSGLFFSFVLMSDSLPHQRHERETDLIGAYFKFTNLPLRLQYSLNGTQGRDRTEHQKAGQV